MVIDTFIGVYQTAFNANMADIKTCPKLHNMAWWIFTGYLIIACCILAGIFCTLVCTLATMGAGQTRTILTSAPGASAANGRETEQRADDDVESCNYLALS